VPHIKIGLRIRRLPNNGNIVEKSHFKNYDPGFDRLANRLGIQKLRYVGTRKDFFFLNLGKEAKLGIESLGRDRLMKVHIL
jgi:hypothetical protein